MKNTIKIKAIISSSLIVSFLITTLTGIGLYFAPSERIARATNWTFLSFSKTSLENVHTIFGFIMAALIIIHFLLNYKLFKGEIKALNK